MSITFYIIVGIIVIAAFLVLALLAISPAIVAPDDLDEVQDDPRPAQVLREAQKGVGHG